MRHLFYFVLLLSCFSCKTPNGNAQFSNHLANESSPYLLQHANNPVDWHPWNEETLAKAKAENKLILVSVGYSACHWCHVMEHESFEDTAVARIMNEHFVNIKVDREERPDVDDVYMTACHLATGRNCGWPLNAFALPDGRPVWAGTYFPKTEWLSVLEYFIKTRDEEPDKLETYADQLLSGIKQNGQIAFNESDQNFTDENLAGITKEFLKNIDFKKGGREGSPKFPMPNNYQFLLQEYYQTGNKKALEAVTTTLDKMANGGIYDHLGGGFARYSTDDKWKVPHFEKMLYDNSQLVSLYSNAYQVTKNPLYQQVVEETLAFVERELMHKDGSFYSSLDADSEGVEGKFYVWTEEELATVFQDEDQLKIFSNYYEVYKKGNWEESNILHRKKSAEEVAKISNITTAELDKIIIDSKRKLMKARDQRIRPGLDNKVLAGLNALMLKGYVDAYKAFGKAAYLQTALKNANFITDKLLQKDNRLNRNYKNGKAGINAFLDDYALMADAFIALYQVTFEEEWLYKAKDLVDYATSHFFDKKSGMYNYTSDLDPPLIARKMETSDNVIPASNSVIAKNLYLLGLYFYDEAYLAKSKQMMHNMSSTIIGNDQPNFYSNWCSLYGMMVNPPYEVAIVGKDYASLQKEWQTQYLPNAILLGGADEGTLDLLESKLQKGVTMIYVCQNKVCKFPVEEVSAAVQLLDK